VAGVRYHGKDVPLYVIAQVLGAILAAYTVCCIARGQPGFMLEPNGLAVNGVDSQSPGGYSMQAAS
jgi:aquaporin Z